MGCEDVCLIAAERGDLPMLQYAHEQGCPWSRKVCRAAARRGDLQMLKYAHEQGLQVGQQRVHRGS